MEMSQRLILTIENRVTHPGMDRNLGFDSPGVTCHMTNQ